jgi:hypothetical protein
MQFMAPLAAIIVLSFCATAHAAGLAVTDASIDHGKLTVKGTTVAANQTVTLDGQFTTQSTKKKAFVFVLDNYHPAACVVTVAVGAAEADGVVANCGQGFGGVNTSVFVSQSAGAVASHTCFNASLGVSGVVVGDAGLVSMAGGVAVPAGLIFSFLKVTGPDTVALRICNPTDSPSAAYTDLELRVVTFR